MTATSTAPSSEPKTPGQVLHEARMAAGAGRPRPWPPQPWAERLPELQRLDEEMAAAVAAVAVAAERARLAEVRQVAVDFCRHHVVLNPQAEALWHAVLQVIDRDKAAGPETPLSDAQHAIGQVIRHAESWQERGGFLTAPDVAAILLGVLAPWTGGGQESSDER